MTASADYDAWGNPVITSGTISTPFLHKGGQGYQSDPDSGLLLMGRRYYDPTEGRFLSRDPRGYGGKELNLYRYANNNPVNASDPSGEVVETIIDVVTTAMDIWEFAQEPTWEGAGIVILGIVCTILPGIPNLGIAAKVLRKGPKIKFQVKYPDVASHLDDMPAGGCFPAGTLIRMADGSQKRIERIRAGDEVLTRDEWSGERGYGKVARTFTRPHDTLLRIETADGRSIEATPEHPFWVEGKGFVAARRLARSDLLVDETGRTSVIIQIESRKGQFTAYNFEVAGTHSYIAAEWWVHNTCPGRSLDGPMEGADYYPSQLGVHGGDIDDIAEQMRNRTWDWDYSEPIRIDETGHIMDGHHRYIAAQITGTPIPDEMFQPSYSQYTGSPRDWGDVYVFQGHKP